MVGKDGQNLQKYVAIAAIMYPQSVYFPTISINNYLETGNYPALITAGEAALQRFPANNVLRYSLGSGLFTYTYASTTTAGTKKKLYVKLEQQLKALIKSEPDSARGHLLLGKHLYNKAADLQKNAGSKSVLFALTECIKSLKICIQKASGANNDIRQEALRILVTTLKATGQPKEAELYTSEAMDQ
jgi:predicted Zn-dependent protease